MQLAPEDDPGGLHRDGGIGLGIELVEARAQNEDPPSGRIGKTAGAAREGRGAAATYEWHTGAAQFQIGPVARRASDNALPAALLGPVLQLDMKDDGTGHASGVDRALVGIDIQRARE